jgi:hypothetical protein
VTVLSHYRAGCGQKRRPAHLFTHDASGRSSGISNSGVRVRKHLSGSRGAQRRHRLQHDHASSVLLFSPAVLSGLSAAGGIALVNSMGVAAGSIARYMIGALRDFTGNAATGMFVLAGSWTVGGLSALTFPVIRKHS